MRKEVERLEADRRVAEESAEKHAADAEATEALYKVSVVYLSCRLLQAT